MVNAIWRRAVSLSFVLVGLHALLRVLDFDEHTFAKDAREWVHRSVRQTSATLKNSYDGESHSTRPTTSGVDVRHSPHLDVLDIMDWEVDCIKEGALLVKSNETERSRERQLRSRCNPPPQLIVDCCEGPFSSAGTVVNVALEKCALSFKSSEHRNSVLQRHARTFLAEMPVPNRGNSALCDVCEIVEVSRQNNLTITFLGDSMQAQVFQGLIYELQRRNYKIKLVNNSTQNEGFWKTIIQYRETLEIWADLESYPPVTMKFFQVYILPFQYSAEMAEAVNSGDILVLGFGLHWNSNVPEHPMSLPGAYVSSMLDLLSYIRLNGTRTKLLVHRETSAQHFDAPQGDYSIWHTAPDRVHQCKPIKEHPGLSSWRETCVKEATSQAGFRYVLAGSNMPRYSVGSKSPANGKSSEELIVLPFYNFTAEHYDQHPPEEEADCTHYCPSPFLYLPLWRSLRIVMDRQFARGEESNGLEKTD